MPNPDRDSRSGSLWKVARPVAMFLISFALVAGRLGALQAARPGRRRKAARLAGPPADGWFGDAALVGHRRPPVRAGATGRHPRRVAPGTRRSLVHVPPVDGRLRRRCGGRDRARRRHGPLQHRSARPAAVSRRVTDHSADRVGSDRRELERQAASVRPGPAEVDDRLADERRSSRSSRSPWGRSAA